MGPNARPPSAARVRDAEAAQAAAALGCEVKVTVSHTLYDPRAIVAKCGGKAPASYQVWKPPFLAHPPWLLSHRYFEVFSSLTMTSLGVPLTAILRLFACFPVLSFRDSSRRLGRSALRRSPLQTPLRPSRPRWKTRRRSWAYPTASQLISRCGVHVHCAGRQGVVWSSLSARFVQ